MRNTRELSTYTHQRLAELLGGQAVLARDASALDHYEQPGQRQREAEGNAQQPGPGEGVRPQCRRGANEHQPEQRKPEPAQKLAHDPAPGAPRRGWPPR